MEAQIVRKKEAAVLAGLSVRTMERLVSRGEFPAPVRLSERTRGWRVAEVREWAAQLEKVVAA